MQGYNGIKYFLTIVAVSVRTAYSINKGLSWKVVAWVSSIMAAIFGTYWDLVIDWGLLQRNSKNPWLRDKLLIPYQSVYFAAIVSYNHKRKKQLWLYLPFLYGYWLIFKFAGHEYLAEICLATNCAKFPGVFLA